MLHPGIFVVLKLFGVYKSIYQMFSTLNIVIIVPDISFKKLFTNTDKKQLRGYHWIIKMYMLNVV